MLEGVWKKGNPLTLLVGMQTSTATMENSVETSYKTGNRKLILNKGTTVESSNSMNFVLLPTKAICGII